MWAVIRGVALFLFGCCVVISCYFLVGGKDLERQLTWYSYHPRVIAHCDFTQCAESPVLQGGDE